MKQIDEQLRRICSYVRLFAFQEIFNAVQFVELIRRNPFDFDGQQFAVLVLDPDVLAPRDDPALDGQLPASLRRRDDFEARFLDVPDRVFFQRVAQIENVLQADVVRFLFFPMPDQ